MKRASKFAIAFDIDGVLTRTPNPIAGAKEALDLLHILGIPFCLLTNGGGGTEAKKANSLSKLLGLSQPLIEEQVCLSHTPMKALVSSIGHQPVLLVGKHYDHLKDVASSYGFRKPITVDELHACWPHLYPDMKPPHCEVGATSDLLKDEGFAGILAFTDPLTWGRELQIITDVMRAPNGKLSDVSNNSHSIGIKQQVPVYNACADFTYSSKWPTARFGAGAFRVALEHLWKELSSQELSQVLYGKPYTSQYHYVESMLKSQHPSHELHRFYMVGDNPTTDIRGANQSGDHWRGVLTRSGLWAGDDNDPYDPAHAVVDDVLAAVNLILQQECVRQ